MRWQIQCKASASEELRTIPKNDLSQLRVAIESLKTTPFPLRAQKLNGAQQLYRLRLGFCRIVYLVDQSTITITVIRSGHRRDVYKNL